MISLLHPSRGRAQKALETAKQWIISAGDVQVEHVLSLDESDPDVKDYVSAFNYNAHLFRKWHMIVQPNTCVVEAVNHAARNSGGDLLVYLSDDFECFDGWGEALERIASEYFGEFLIKVNDGHQKFLAPVLTIPIVSRALYNKLGYFFNPIYRNQWVDNDLFQVCLRMGVIKYHEELTFLHRHPDADSSVKWDSTYSHNSSSAAHEYGRMIFEQRVKERFQ